MTCFFKIKCHQSKPDNDSRDAKGSGMVDVSDQMTIVNLSCVAIKHLFSSNSWC